MNKNILLLTLIITFGVLVKTAEATPSCQPCPYSCADLGLGHKDCSVQSTSGGICCLDLSHKGLEIADARASVARSAGNYGSGGCPAGFHPSSSKCSPDDRRRGCKDLHGSNGETCTNK